MKLLRIVKVGNITNLSDARYCAGMGVDMLGFCVVENRPGYVSPAAFQEFRGWFAGPSIVAEAYGIADANTMHGIMQNYLPDFIELSVDELPFMDIPSIALMVAIRNMPVYQFLEKLTAVHTQVAYVLAEENMPASYIEELAGYYPVLLRLNGPLNRQHLTLPIKGFALAGGTEEKPGLKSYDSLADVLEQLSED